MDINWRQEYEAAVIERNGLIMALTAAEERESAVVARAEAAERRVAELEARLAEMEARADRNQGSADVLDTMDELMFGWEDDD